MKAVVQYRYGPADEVLSVREIDKPIPKENEVLIKVRASSMHADIWHTVNGVPLVTRLMGGGLFKPRNRVPGTDVAGIVESIGSRVTRFKVGDAVFGTTVFMRLWNGGTYAQYVSVPEHMLMHKPDNVTFEQAASVPTSGVIALCNLRSARIESGSRVLVNGAGGSVGALAIQIAKFRGAHVTGVDVAARLESISALGADRVIDYTKEDFTKGAERFDLIFDVATTLSVEDCERVLTPTGLHWMIGHDHYGKASGRVFGSIPRLVRFMVRQRRKGRAIDMKLPPVHDLLESLRDWLHKGVITPVVGKTFTLSEVPAAMRCLEESTLAGRVVITLQ
jgi:NADPH:quinone reductase-like Zn-dependent oxidoreductase